MINRSDFSIFIGGKAGDGIDKASLIIAHLLNQLNFRIYIYRDYPSVIRGAHTFSIIRASKDKISAHLDKVDFVLALNQDCIDLHKNRLKDNSFIIYDSSSIKPETLPLKNKNLGISLEKILKEEDAPALMRNSCVIGALCKVIGIKLDILEGVFHKEITRDIDLNIKVATRGYKEAQELIAIEKLSQPILPLLTGNEAIGLGLIKGGLNTYIAYPMTPSSALLHFLAEVSSDFGLKVIHPESEIGVILMALGFSYAGEKVAVGTSGGGFCLMSEGLSLSGMAELPVVIMVGQRPGPSTGLPTYTSQTELQFVLSAGQGEFSRFIVAPSDAQEAYFWSAVAMNFSWKYQIPAFILSDKTLCEGVFSFDISCIEKIKEEAFILWDRKSPFNRYLDTQTGISPLSFVPDKDAVIKVNSYEHDEFGLTTEDPQKTKMMQDKRLRKEEYLSKELEAYKTVEVYGDKNSSDLIICWGSNKGVCAEVAQRLGLKVVVPLVLCPFPLKQFQQAIAGAKKIISVENNATAQLVRLINRYGFSVNEKILKYDGRPFSLEDLENRLKEIIK